MSRINVCPACNAAHNGVKSRIAFEHTCGKVRFRLPLRSVDGYASYVCYPDEETIAAVNAMAELAFKNLKKDGEIQD